MWRFLIVIAVFIETTEGAEKLEVSLREGDPCPSINNYPESSCRKNCSSMIQSHILRETLTEENVVQCNEMEKLICCPNQPPQDPSIIPTIPPKSPGNSSSELDPQTLYPHMGSFRYLNAITLDSYLYRCAALIVKQNLVLTSAYCAGLEDVVEMPNRFRLGLVNPFQEELPTKNSYVHNDDLVLFGLTGNFKMEAVAKICRQQDIDSCRKLVAVGFAQKDDVNCEWFEQEVSLKPFGECNVVTTLKVDGESHLCVYPINTPEVTKGSCFRCLRAGASVLHAIQADGSVCAAGVATPTGGGCYNIGRADLHYTSLVNQSALDFINGSH
ncbi:uncharacterized protein LOC108088589 [Drosophila ficusphila]|uniref:uncharacterized protein LOC108088589 n=1 Tax=Drosophila ficusphila TaxID=30025 RepID=UPI0007E7FA2E|nr:uncharacterized protein LOC108088589 [Drosophila ficusphila]